MVTIVLVLAPLRQLSCLGATVFTVSFYLLNLLLSLNILVDMGPMPD